MTSLFSVVYDIADSTNELKYDLEENKRAVRWKMSINPDPLKRARDVILFRNVFKIKYQVVQSKHSIVNFGSNQKHFFMIID